jgi:hypothetical protein
MNYEYISRKAIAIKTLARSLKERREAAVKSKKTDYYLRKIAQASKNRFAFKTETCIHLVLLTISYQVCDPGAIASAIARHKKLMAKSVPLMERRAAAARAKMADYALRKAAEASMNGHGFCLALLSR